MKKLLLALPLVAGASWAGTTYYSGAQTEAAYTRLLEQLSSSDVFVLKSTEYEAGFMESTAITEVRSADRLDEDIHFFLKHTIKHSPVSVAPENPRFGAASIVTTLMVDDSYSDDAKEFLSAFESGEPFIATTEVAVDGSTNSEIKINPVDFTKDDGTLTTSGADINLLTTASGNITGNAINKDFSFSEGDDKQANMSNFNVEFNLSKLEKEGKVSPFLYDASFDMKMDETKIVEDGQQVALIKGVKYIIDQDLSADDPSANFSIGVNSLEVPAVPLKSFNLDGVLTGFSIMSLMTNEAFFEELKSADKPEELFFGEKGLAILRDTFKPDTQLALRANAVSTEGDADAAIDFSFVGNGTPDGYTGMTTTGDLAKTFSGTAVVDIDKAALMLTPLGAMLDNPMAQAYLTITDDKVTLNADLKELVLKLNEQMIPLEMMAGEMMNMPLESLLQQM